MFYESGRRRPVYGKIAVETAAVARDLTNSTHPQTTLSETLMAAAEAFIGQPTHIYRLVR